MKKLKIGIICLVVCIVICILLIAYLHIDNSNSSENKKNISQEPTLELNKDVNDLTDYIEENPIVVNGIINFLYYVELKNENAVNIICNNYSGNIPNGINKIKFTNVYSIDNLINQVYLFGININGEIYYYIMNIDSSTYAYKLEEIDKEDVEKIRTNNIDEKYKSYNKIENEVYNSINFDEDLICRYLFYNLKNLALESKDNLYNLLDNEYKKLKFDDNKLNFDGYISSMVKKIDKSMFVSYEVQEMDSGKVFVVQDDYENQYVFIENSFLDYSIRLDNYTILTENYTMKYNKLDSESKAKTNVDMFIKMINSGDYQYAFNKLDETYRNNNFGNVENFENYIKENFFENNYLIVNKIEQKGEYYVVNTTIKSNISSAADSIEKNFIVKLNEATDFAISFEI